MSGAPPDHLEDQYERTLLAWRRTALSLVATGLLVGHLSVVGTGRPALFVLLAGLGGVVGFVWLGRARVVVGATGLALVMSLAVLGALAMRGILTR